MWSAVFDVVLKPYHFSQTAAGWLAFATMLGGIIGGRASLGCDFVSLCVRCVCAGSALLCVHRDGCLLLVFTVCVSVCVCVSDVTAHHHTQLCPAGSATPTSAAASSSSSFSFSTQHSCSSRGSRCRCRRLCRPRAYSHTTPTMCSSSPPQAPVRFAVWCCVVCLSIVCVCFL